MPAETTATVRTRLATVKSELLELAAESDLDDAGEERFSALTAETASLTRRLAVLEASEPATEIVDSAGDVEAAEFAALISEADAGDVLDHVTFGRRMDGPTLELLDELAAPYNVVPFEMLQEFAASTTKSAGDAVVQEPTIRQVFPTALGVSMGVSRPMVDVGLRSQPVVTAPADGPDGYTAIGSAATDVAVTIGATNLAPQRLQVQCTVGRDELATFRGLLGDVERVLRDALASALDGRAVAALFAAGTAPTATTSVATFATGLAAVTDCLDGRYAGDVGDLRVLLGVATARLFERTYRSNEDAMTLSDALRGKTGGIMASAHVAAPASDNQQGLVSRGDRVATVQAVWGPGVEILDDPYSLSSDGQRRITACVMTDVEVVRAAQYKRLSFHLA